MRKVTFYFAVVIASISSALAVSTIRAERGTSGSSPKFPGQAICSPWDACSQTCFVFGDESFKFAASNKEACSGGSIIDPCNTYQCLNILYYSTNCTGTWTVEHESPYNSCVAAVPGVPPK